MGSVTVDVSAAAPTPALESDTGTSASDHVTSDGTVVVSGLEDGASYEYSTDGGTTWVAGTGTSFTLGEGTYADVQVRQSDAAGNVSAAASLGAVTVDTSAAAPVVALASDTGTSNSDGITSDGTVTVSGLEDGRPTSTPPMAAPRGLRARAPASSWRQAPIPMSKCARPMLRAMSARRRRLAA
ncbi:hypothetical protein [Novosphingobium sp. 9]|uniref:hypothetical protein n=1 Tax=Novosphingobium sp. 9 TaxID=2025349 RepID=UPI0021B5F69A|nr:hypothetical protein [Novosphingobium sp. 9]